MNRNGCWRVNLLIVGSFLASPAWSASFVVDSTADAIDQTPGDGVCAAITTTPGKCTLRAAVMEANASPGADVITFASAGQYFLNLRNPNSSFFGFESDPKVGDIEITESLTIKGDTAVPVVIHGGGQADFGALKDRLFQISPPAFGSTGQPIDVTIEGLTLKGGYQPNENWGGGAVLVYNVMNGPFIPTALKLTLRNVIMDANYSYVTGGAVSSYGGDILIENSQLTNNRTPYIRNNQSGQFGFPGGAFLGGGQGGAVAAWGGSLIIRGSTITGNWAQTGGAVYAQDASATPTYVLLEDCVVQGNLGFMGAAFFNAARGSWNIGTAGLVTHGMVLNRVTVTANLAEFAGAGMYNIGTVRVANSTFSLNEAWLDGGPPTYRGRGGGIYNSGRVMDIESSTIAGNENKEPRTLRETADLSYGGDEIFLDWLTAGGQGSSQPFRFTIKNSIIGDGPNPNPGDPANILPGAAKDDNCAGPVTASDTYLNYITSLGNNIDSGNTCFKPATAAAAAKSLTITAAVSADQVDAGTIVDPLLDNGGRVTLPDGTHVLTRALSASATVAIGTGAGCPGSDQRGFARIGCDVGAFQTAVNTADLGNAAPTARDDVVSVESGKTVQVAVLANDSDPDVTDKLAFDQSLALPPGASYWMSGFGPNDVPLIKVVAPTVTTATTLTVPYRITDGKATATANLKVVVYPPGANRPPVGAPDVVNVNVPTSGGSGGNNQGAPTPAVSIDVLSNDIDPDEGDVLTVDKSSLPQSLGVGSVSLDATNRVLSFQPNSNAPAGPVTFTYVPVDNRGGRGDPVTVTLNYPPTINVQSNDLPSVAPNGTLSGQVVVVDPDGGALTVTADGADFGTVAISNNGLFTYTAKPDATVGATDQFQVVASDGYATARAFLAVKIAAADTGTGSSSSGGDTSSSSGGGTSSGANSSSGGTNTVSPGGSGTSDDTSPGGTSSSGGTAANDDTSGGSSAPAAGGGSSGGGGPLAPMHVALMLIAAGAAWRRRFARLQ
jgi:CSLREA domain-containing protein